ncbi:MAG: hypothetical protein AAGC93_16380 [Cyanobacteria bacterium P01_F01_bin.53]
MKVLVDGITCIMMLMIILLISKIVFPEKTEALLNDADTRWNRAVEHVEQESQPQ